MDAKELQIEYNTPIEVSESEYKVLMNKFAGIIAGQKNGEGKHFIKLWLMQYKKQLIKSINKLRE